MNPCTVMHGSILHLMMAVMVLHASITTENEVSIMVLCLLCSQQHELRTVGKVHLYQSSHYEKCRKFHVPHLSFETEVSSSLLCQLCSTHYTVIRIKNCLKSIPVIKVATMKSTVTHHVQPPNQCQQRCMKHKGGH